MDRTLRYARGELKKYWYKATGEKNCPIAVGVVSEPGGDGAYEHFVLDIEKGRGTVSAANGRSALLAVYRLFSELGCCFFRPGEDGEYIERFSAESVCLHRDVTPSYGHRGITIEGAASLEHVLGLVEWAPKAGFNAYFIQFRDGYNFFDRWYKHDSNELLESEPFDGKTAADFYKRIVDEVHKRGMMFHGVGHGWTCECLGISSKGWYKSDAVLSPENTELLAMTGGTRQFHKGIPLNTHLCYSNPKARDLLCGEIVKYAAEHTEVDYLHFWLADDYNNICECQKCNGGLRLADYYIMMLNDVDARLTARGLGVKIVFLVYLELSWTAVWEKIKNPGRFVLMYAPIFRTFSRPLTAGGRPVGLPEREVTPYKLNDVKYPSGAAENLAFLYAWQREFTGDSFIFDYHLMWDIYKEFSGLSLSETISEDMKGLRDIGLNGNVSCQVQRAFYPNALCMYTMGETLFDRKKSFAAVRDKYFRSAYGRYRKQAEAFFKTVGAYFNHRYVCGELEMINPDAARDMSAARPLLQAARESFAAIVAGDTTPLERANIGLALNLADLLLLYAPLLGLKAQGKIKTPEAESYRERIKRHIAETEIREQSAVDGYYLDFIITETLDKDWTPL